MDRRPEPDPRSDPVAGPAGAGRPRRPPREQDRAQPFEVDLDVEADLSVAGASDHLPDTVDYGALAAVGGARSSAASAPACSNAWPTGRRGWPARIPGSGPSPSRSASFARRCRWTSLGRVRITRRARAPRSDGRDRHHRGTGGGCSSARDEPGGPHRQPAGRRWRACPRWWRCRPSTRRSPSGVPTASRPTSTWWSSWGHRPLPPASGSKSPAGWRRPPAGCGPSASGPGPWTSTSSWWATRRSTARPHRPPPPDGRAALRGRPPGRPGARAGCAGRAEAATGEVRRVGRLDDDERHPPSPIGAGT